MGGWGRSVGQVRLTGGRWWVGQAGKSCPAFRRTTILLDSSTVCSGLKQGAPRPISTRGSISRSFRPCREFPKAPNPPTRLTPPYQSHPSYQPGPAPTITPSGSRCRRTDATATTARPGDRGAGYARSGLTPVQPPRTRPAGGSHGRPGATPWTRTRCPSRGRPRRGRRTTHSYCDVNLADRQVGHLDGDVIFSRAAAARGT